MCRYAKTEVKVGRETEIWGTEYNVETSPKFEDQTDERRSVSWRDSEICLNIIQTCLSFSFYFALVQVMVPTQHLSSMPQNLGRIFLLLCVSQELAQVGTSRFHRIDAVSYISLVSASVQTIQIDVLFLNMVFQTPLTLYTSGQAGSVPSIGSGILVQVQLSASHQKRFRHHGGFF